MKTKTMMIALVASVGLCTQSFGFEALDRMLGMVFDKPTCCDGKSSQKSSQKGGCARHGCHKSRCGCDSSKAVAQKSKSHAQKGHTQKGSAQKGHTQKGSAQKGRCGCAGKASQKVSHSSQKGGKGPGCRQPLFGGCGCKKSSGGKTKVAQKDCGASQKGGKGHCGLLDRLFSGGCKSAKGGKGDSNGVIRMPEQGDGLADPGVPPAPIVDPASFVPHRAMALDR